MYKYILFYKPFQVLSQFSPEGDKKTLAHFFPSIEKDIYPVGRLDFDSEGLILLTNDKKLNHLLLDPKNHYEKEYWVQVEGNRNEVAYETLRNGVKISHNSTSYQTKPCKVNYLGDNDEELKIPIRNPPIRYRKSVPDHWISITLTEGKNRQVRKMTASVNLPTLRLIRYRIGALIATNLNPGESLNLNDKQVKELINYTKKAQ